MASNVSATPVKVPKKAAGKKGLPAKVRPRAGQGVSQARPMTASGIKTAVSALGKGAFEAYEEIEALVHTHEQNKLSVWWHIGKKFLTIEEQWKEDGLATFCAVLGVNDREVRMAMRAARLWQEADIAAIVDQARKHGGNVTWSHVRLLLALDDANREKYLAVIQKERIGHEPLMALIRSELDAKDGKGKGKGKGKKGGRNFNIPTTFDGIYMASIRQITQFQRYIDQMGKKLPGALDKIDEARFNPELLTRVRKMREECDHVVEVAQGRAVELTNFERRIEQRLGLQPADDVPAAPPAADKKVITRKPPAAAKVKKG